ncbi:Elicitin-like protein, partial [Globisporangium splendens]
MHRHRFTHAVVLAIAVLGCNSASSSLVHGSDPPLLECDATVLRPFISGFVGEHCVFETGYRSGFAMLSAVPTSTQMRAICRSRACKMLFQKAAEQYNGVDCIVPTGNRLRLHADLTDQVAHRCPDMKDVYTLMDCMDETSANNPAEASITREFWYYPDSTNLSYVPEETSKHTVVSKESTNWEGGEVAVHHDGWDIVAYIDEHGAQERIGEYVGVMEAGRIVPAAFACMRGDDHVFQTPGPRPQESSSFASSTRHGVQCRRRYVCASEE